MYRKTKVMDLGFHPIGFLEDGNQLGIWMVSFALIVSPLFERSLADRVLRLPVKWAALLLISVTHLCQSVGSIVKGENMMTNIKYYMTFGEI